MSHFRSVARISLDVYIAGRVLKNHRGIGDRQVGKPEAHEIAEMSEVSTHKQIPVDFQQRMNKTSIPYRQGLSCGFIQPRQHGHSRSACGQGRETYRPEMTAHIKILTDDCQATNIS